MLLYCFVCSIIFTIVMVTFIIASIYYGYKQRKIIEESERMINGFKTYNLEGGSDDKKEK